MQEKGQMFAYRNKGILTLAIIFSQKVNKIQILNENNKKSNLNLEKIEFRLKKYLSVDAKEFEIVKHIKSIKKIFDESSQLIKLKDLYDLLKEEKEGFTLKAMTEYYFSQANNEDNFLIMLFALEKDKLFFKFKNNLYYPRSFKEVKELLAEKERSQINKKNRLIQKEKVINWLNQFILNNFSKNLLPLPLEVIKYLEPIRNYIIFRDEYQKKSEVLNLIKEIKTKCGLIINESIQGMFEFYQKMGIFKQDENLAILKYHIPTKFDPKIIKIAEEIECFDRKSELNNIRIDLSDHYTVTIDDSETEDIDDALSIKFIDKGYQIGVHIADVSYFIKQNSILDKEALSRSMSVYLPVEQISMFPKILSEHKMSLIEKKYRPSISFLILFDFEENLINKNIVVSSIKVNRRLTYKEVHNILYSEKSNEDFSDKELKFFQIFYKIAKKLKFNREKKGALDFNRDSIKIRINSDGKINIKTLKSNYMSNLIVKEFMILINGIIANLFYKNNLPALYVCQDKPDELNCKNQNLKNDKVLKINKIRKMKQSEISINPSQHFSLAMNCYTHFTSPIRRYHDLILHRQIKHFLLTKKVLYSSEEIQKIAAITSKAIQEVKTIERETNRYWILKYLQQEKNNFFKAIVIRELNNSYLIEIKKVFIPVLLITQNSYVVGDQIDIIIDQINPLLDILTVKLKND